MAKERFRGVSDDERRYPNFEGIGSGFTNDVNMPGANRGNVGGAGFAFPIARTGQSRLQGLQSSAAGQGRGLMRGSGAGRAAGGYGGGGGTGFTVQGSGAFGNAQFGGPSVQGKGNLYKGKPAASKGKAGGLGVRG